MTDCATLTANKNYYQAACTYDAAEVSLANSELAADEMSYYAALQAWYSAGCNAMAKLDEVESRPEEKPPIEAFPVADSLMQRFAEERSELRKKHIALMISTN